MDELQVIEEQPRPADVAPPPAPAEAEPPEAPEPERVLLHMPVDVRSAALVLLAVSCVLNLIIAAAEITAPSSIAFPLWDWVIKVRFLRGALRDFPHEALGWSPWAGFWLYVAIALLFATLLLLTLRRAREADQPAG
jgi:hypothetical protein